MHQRHNGSQFFLPRASAPYISFVYHVPLIDILSSFFFSSFATIRPTVLRITYSRKKFYVELKTTPVSDMVFHAFEFFTPRKNLMFIK